MRKSTDLVYLYSTPEGSVIMIRGHYTVSHPSFLLQPCEVLNNLKYGKSANTGSGLFSVLSRLSFLSINSGCDTLNLPISDEELKKCDRCYLFSIKEECV